MIARPWISYWPIATGLFYLASTFFETLAAEARKHDDPVAESLMELATDLKAMSFSDIPELAKKLGVDDPH